MKRGKLIRTLDYWRKHTKASNSLRDLVIQNLDFTKEAINWESFELDNTVFISCDFKQEDAFLLMQMGAFIYPKFDNLPFNPNRKALYTHEELLEGYDPVHDNSTDLQIYKHFSLNKYNPGFHIAMAQRLHDFNIDESIRELMGYNDLGMTDRKAIGFMGGHSTRRGSEFYIKSAQTAKLLAEEGYYIVSGGGPGIMEAANLGAYMANKTEAELMDAIEILSDLDFGKLNPEETKDFLAKNYLIQAKKVLDKYPSTTENLAIPTWFYGHEPTNVFATHVAKYFSNSIREDVLLAISLYGVIFAPGSAGTTQEIFQEAAQNHYGTFGYYSPMIFLGKKRYVEDSSLYSVLHQLAIGQEYKKLLYLTDEPELIVDFIKKNPPIPVA
ncbi:LOG family protein [Ornithobacterium rhinotracheale]|uniref:LOG family protein n=1 Tax=Ornithobacterium rhinotracheale TaxID=28251 RepID=UPI001FF6EE76|nr:hypothetical protein [Ornithobacterium rhinotracheale]MCK0204236.1 hypothetical protein [Ornithobacterium rhinotracheale]